jgi:ankyrin repeat protein
VFLERGVDPKVRNAAGATALELLFIEDQFPPYNAERDYDRFYAAANEIVDTFEQKGYVLKETNAAGQTLLHLVAKWAAYRAVPWFDLLKAKGLDPETKNVDGVTALQSAKMNLYMRGSI